MNKKYLIILTHFLLFIFIVSACKKKSGDPAPPQKTITGSWDFNITTTSGSGTNTLTFSGTNDGGTFTDVNGHGGPWSRVNDSIFWEYTTGTTLPSGLINKIRGKLNTAYTAINANSAGIFNGTTFTGTWTGTKR